MCGYRIPKSGIALPSCFQYEASKTTNITFPTLGSPSLKTQIPFPSIYKLFSLSAIYRSTFADLLAIFGIDLASSARFQLDVPLANTHRVAFETPHPAAAVTFPTCLDRAFSLEKTNLVSRAVEVWGNVPASLFQRLDLRHTQYGYIGTCDFTMYPLLRPGTFVQN